MRGLPRGHAILHVGDLIGGEVLANHLAIGCILFLVRPTNAGGKIKPEIRLNVILGHALAKGVEHAQRCLRGRVALICCPAIPRCRLLHIARNGLASAIAIERGQVHFSGNVILVGGLSIPRELLLIVAGHLRFVMVVGGRLRIVLAQRDLGRGVAGIGLGLQGRVNTGLPGVAAPGAVCAAAESSVPRNIATGIEYLLRFATSPSQILAWQVTASSVRNRCQNGRGFNRPGNQLKFIYD